MVKLKLRVLLVSIIWMGQSTVIMQTAKANSSVGSQECSPVYGSARVSQDIVSAFFDVEENGYSLRVNFKREASNSIFYLNPDLTFNYEGTNKGGLYPYSQEPLTISSNGKFSIKVIGRRYVCTYRGLAKVSPEASARLFSVSRSVEQSTMSKLEPKPDKNSINSGLTSPPPSYMRSVLGVPGQLSNNCSSVTNANLKKIIVTENIGSFKVTGLKPAVFTVRRALDKVRIEKPDLYKQLGTEGMLCVRKVRGGSDFSNHSWGTAVDIKINQKLDVRGDNKTQIGLKELYPYFHEEGFYWGAAFPIEDSMHFEASQQLIERWKASGEIP